MPSTNQYGGLVTSGLRDNHRCHGLGIFEKAVVDSNNGRAGMPLVSPGRFTPKVTTEIQTFLSKSPRRRHPTSLGFTAAVRCHATYTRRVPQLHKAGCRRHKKLGVCPDLNVEAGWLIGSQLQVSNAAHTASTMPCRLCRSRDLKLAAVVR